MASTAECDTILPIQNSFLASGSWNDLVDLVCSLLALYAAMSEQPPDEMIGSVRLHKFSLVMLYSCLVMYSHCASETDLLFPGFGVGEQKHAPAKPRF